MLGLLKIVELSPACKWIIKSVVGLSFLPALSSVSLTFLTPPHPFCLVPEKLTDAHLLLPDSRAILNLYLKFGVCVSFPSNKESGVTTNKEEDRLQRATLQAEAAER